jgi:hypothetical protein
MLSKVVKLQHPKIIPLGKQHASHLLNTEKLTESSFVLVKHRPADGGGRNRGGSKVLLVVGSTKLPITSQ